MNTPRFASLLLLTSALTMPSLAWAQGADTGAEVEPTPDSAPSDLSDQANPGDQSGEEAAPDISLPGEIIVTGTRTRNVVKSSAQVISVLSTEQIARTGEGNIAGALGRVTGLSIVGSGFVYVRGLGDRYSLALLNGAPLPSPEPLRRVVPLDIFPTNIVASSLVQKSYSVNFPGEFGGGVINLTTTAVPKESYLSISTGISGDSETTGHHGYTYYGAASDWTGFDNGSRNVPPALAAFFASGQRITDIGVNQQQILGEMVRFSRATIQRVGNLPPNFSATISGGSSFEVGDATIGVIATAGFSNKWVNREARQQTAATADLTELFSDYTRVTTDNRIVANGLIGLGAEFGDHKARLTGLYIRDTIKQGRLAVGDDFNQNLTRMFQDTAWFERQLIDTQFIGEFRFGDLGLDLRASYANSQREAPYETSFGYSRTNNPADPFGQIFINPLNNGQRGEGTVAFSNLNEDLWFGGADVSYRLTDRLNANVGYSYTDTTRVSTRREFLIIAPADLPTYVASFRPDLLLAPGIVDFYKIGLIENTESFPSFAAALKIHGAYGKLNYEPLDGLSLDVGVRYESARQSVNPLTVFNENPNEPPGSTTLKNSYWLPAATVTWEIAPQMQLRLNASKTIARPQFRELIFQLYFDPESDRLYRGNPRLIDSQLKNAEARFEWYFAPDQRFSISGFYKDISRPIEAFAGFDANRLQTSFANAPGATLYGAEVEVQKYFDVSSMGGWFSDRRAVAIANYTYSKSELKVGADDLVAIFGTQDQPATSLFTDGTPLTGQSKHIANLQLGFENTERLSQQTLLMTFASKRVTSRGPVGLPDILENPGLTIDFVAREGVLFLGQEIDLKIEARNLTGRKRQEYQSTGANRVEINSYDVGRSFSMSASIKF
jgi:outer membrane receptor protein involved in Fe transport